jgi:hypothetical protein
VQETQLRVIKRAHPVVLDVTSVDTQGTSRGHTCGMVADRVDAQPGAEAGSLTAIPAVMCFGGHRCV